MPSKNARNLITFFMLIPVSLGLWYFDLIGTFVLIGVLVVDLVTFFAIRSANSNVTNSNRDIKK